jgi:proline iminopeptidase
MKFTLRNFAALGVTALLLSGLYLVWMPRTYSLPDFEPLSGVQYWELPTGSHIAYVHVARKTDFSKTPVVYVHGGPGGAVRSEQISALEPLAMLGHDLYFYDQIGSGQSGRLIDVTEYSVARHSADLHAVIEQIGAPKVILVGHSWGAVLVANYIQNYSDDRIEKLVFEVPGPILPINQALKDVPSDPRLGLVTPAFSNREANSTAGNARVAWVKSAAVHFGIKWASDEEMDSYMDHWNQSLSRSTVCSTDFKLPKYRGAGYYAHVMTVRSFKNVQNQREALCRIKVPVLVLKAQCDNQPWGYAAEYLDLFSNSELGIVAHSGHSMALEQPWSYLERIATFLAKPNEPER